VVPEGLAVVTNLSSSTHYRVRLMGIITNGALGPARCSPQNVGCVGTFDEIIELAPETDASASCPLPSVSVAGCTDPPYDGCTCGGQCPCSFKTGTCPLQAFCCESTCDNVDCQASTLVCVEITSVAKVLAWSTDGSTWHDYDPPVPFAASCFTRDPRCD
jgi:hypothetical protein